MKYLSSGRLCVPGRFAVFAGVVLLMARVANASPLTLTPVTIFHEFQQRTNNPCVIGDPSCDNGSLPYTVLPTGVDSYDSFSPIYRTTAGLAAGSFSIGIDINESSVVQHLSLFQILVNGAVVDSFVGTVTGCTQPSTNCQDVVSTVGGGNGNGYADYVLSGFSAIPANSLVQFHLVMPLVNAGRDQFFLIGQPTGVPLEVLHAPEPATLVLVGLGGFGYLMRRRNRDASRAS